MNRFMQWFLSPAAYIVWVSLANPDEWLLSLRKDYIYNERMKLLFQTDNGIRRMHAIGHDTWVLNHGNVANDVQEFLGPVEKRILWRRLKRLERTFKHREKNKAKLEAQEKIISRMMRME